MMNIRFEYLYRDAGNYKRWGEVNFSNPSRLGSPKVESLIRQSLIDGHYLVPSDVDLPDLYSEKFDPELDHTWHEYSCVEETEAPPNDAEGRTIEEFIIDISRSFELVKN
jgi:hypothetical protein